MTTIGENIQRRAIPDLKGLISRNGLEHTGLSTRAILAMHRLGKFAQAHPALTAQVIIGVTGYFAEVATNQVLHPEWGPIANLLSPLFFDVSPVEGQYFLNGLQAIAQGMFVIGGATGAFSGLGEFYKNIASGPEIKRGMAVNPYEKMMLMVDRTNEAREGSTHGDFYNEFYRYLLLERPELLPKFIQRYGPICEITPADVSEPADVPVPAYFRGNNSANTEFLRDKVKANRSKGTISVLMSRSHTVWDDEFMPSQADLKTVKNMNATIASTLGAGDIPQIIITNNRSIVTHGAFNPNTGKTNSVSLPVAEYFDGGSKVVIAEHEVMTDLVATFKKKEFKKVILMDDGTPEGEKIASNWTKDYQRLKESDDSLPEIIIVPEGKLGDVLKTEEYDGIFLIGAEDVGVAEAAQIILKSQISDSPDTEGYKKVPMIVLMEGRGSVDELSQIKQYGGELHFVHEIIAKKTIDMLLAE